MSELGEATLGSKDMPMSFLSSMLAFCAASKESIWDLKHSSYSLRLLATAADSPTASACASSASFASCGADRAAAACGTLKLNTPNLAVASIPTVTMIALQVARLRTFPEVETAIARPDPRK